MTRDDFDLFPNRGADGSELDHDIALVTAYLSRELTAIQIIAVEERLACDAGFRVSVQPVIDAWLLSDTSLSGDRELTRPLSLTDTKIESGWQRVASATGARPHANVVTGKQTQRGLHSPGGAMKHSGIFNVSSGALSLTGKILLKRIAAVIALIVLPVAIGAQLAVYAANHDGSPGHDLARAIVPKWLQNGTPSAPEETHRPDDEAAFLRDGPVQFTIQATGQQQPSNVRVVELAAPQAATPQKLGLVFGIREAPDGRLLVNDAGSRQIRLLNRDMTTASVAFDSVPGVATSYGRNRPPLIPFRGDSSLFRAQESNGMLVLDAFGQIARALAFVSGDDAAGISWGQSGVDSRGRLLYKNIPQGVTWQVPRAGSLRPVDLVRAGSIGGRGGGGGSATVAAYITDRPDSVAIRSIDFEMRTIDTVGYVMQPQDERWGPTAKGGGKSVLVHDKKGEIESVKQVINPLYAIDEWAVLSDGTVAFVRGSDYHVDWIHPDGSRSSTAKLPFDWQRVTDEQKQKLIDSTQAAQDSSAPPTGEQLAARGLSNRGSSSAPPGGRATAGRATTAGSASRMWPYEIVPMSKIADYWPPFRTGAAIADRDGNLWILPRTTTNSRKGELVYDVVNPKGGLITRVRLPVGRSIAGFGRGGIVYLQFGDLVSGFILERTKVETSK